MTDPGAQDPVSGHEQGEQEAVQSLARDLAERQANAANPENASGEQAAPEVVAEVADEMGT